MRSCSPKAARSWNTSFARHGGGRLTPAPSHPAFPAYLYWFHFANGTLQPVMGRAMIIRRAGLPTEHPVAAFVAGRLQRAWSLVEARLGEAAWFAGDFTAADIMMVFSLTTMRFFMPVELAPYPNVRTYLQRVGEREAYRRAMAKGDPAIEPLLT